MSKSQALSTPNRDALRSKVEGFEQQAGVSPSTRNIGVSAAAEAYARNKPTNEASPNTQLYIQNVGNAMTDIPSPKKHAVTRSLTLSFLSCKNNKSSSTAAKPSMPYKYQEHSPGETDTASEGRPLSLGSKKRAADPSASTTVGPVAVHCPLPSIIAAGNKETLLSSDEADARYNISRNIPLCNNVWDNVPITLTTTDFGKAKGSLFRYSNMKTDQTRRMAGWTYRTFKCDKCSSIKARIVSLNSPQHGGEVHHVQQLGSHHESCKIPDWTSRVGLPPEVKSYCMTQISQKGRNKCTMQELYRSVFDRFGTCSQYLSTVERRAEIKNRINNFLWHSRLPIQKDTV